MRRPICLMAVSFGAGIFFGFYMGLAKLVALVFIGVFILFLISKAKPNLRNLFCLSLVFFLSGIFCLLLHVNQKDPMLLMVDEYTTIEGMVSDIQKRDEDRYRLIVRTSGENSKVLVNVFGELGIENFGDIAGRHVRISGQVERPAPRRNPKTFDYRLFLQTQGIHVLMNIAPHDMTIIEGDVNRWTNALSNIRHHFISEIIERMDERNAGILIGMLFGDRNFLDDDVYEVFQKNGTAHILAVSGLHVGAVYIFLNKLLKSRRNLFLNMILLFFIFLYVALSGFAPSALRAGGMISMHILSKILCRRYDMLCAGAAMALIMMFFNPLILFGLGFQLSFLAIFVIAIVLPAMRRMVDSDLTAVVSLQASLAPAIAYLFNYFSVAAFFINTPVIFIAGIIIPIGILLIPLSYLPGPMFDIGAGMMDQICGLMVRLNEMTYWQGGLFFHVVSPPIWALFLFYGFLFLGCSEAAWIFFKRKENRKLVLSAVLVVVLVLVGTAPVHDDFHKAQIIFVDVGQGDCIHIRTSGGKNILIDGGGSRNFDVGRRVLMPYLLKNGVRRIDLAIVSHMHLDHYGGIFSLANHFQIDQIGFYEANKIIEDEIVSQTGLQREQIVYFTKGQKIMIDQGVWIEVLYPPQKSVEEYRFLKGGGANENDLSLILKVYYYGVSTLLMGDMTFEGERSLLSKYQDDDGRLNSDILKIGHHGSRFSTSDELLAAVRPDFAVFQVGRNGFGHPTREVLEKVDGINAAIYRNDKHGAIGVFIRRGEENPTIRTIILEK